MRTARQLPTLTLVLIRTLTLTLIIQVVLCTIASTVRIASEMGDSTVHTIIVDEAGATSELALPILLQLQPENIILVGGHYGVTLNIHTPTPNVDLYPKSP